MRSINVSNLLKSATRSIKSLAHAVMRRPFGTVRGTYTFDAPTGRLCVAGRELILRPKTAALFQVLTAQPGRIVSKDELLDRVWPGLIVQEQAVFQCINEIRRACGTKDCIRTHARQGYQWIGLQQVAPPSPTALRRRFRIGSRIAVAAAGCAVLLVAVATVLVEPQPAGGKVRIAVLPVSGGNSVPRDRGLSLVFMIPSTGVAHKPGG